MMRSRTFDVHAENPHRVVEAKTPGVASRKTLATTTPNLARRDGLKSVAPATTARSSRVLLQDKTNKTKTPGGKELGNPMTAKSGTRRHPSPLIKKPANTKQLEGAQLVLSPRPVLFDPSTLKTPSPLMIRKRVPSPTPGPDMSAHMTPVKDDAERFKDMPVEQAATDSAIDVPYDPGFDMMDFNHVNLCNVVARAPLFDTEHVDVAILPEDEEPYLFEAVDWNQTLLGKDYFAEPKPESVMRARPSSILRQNRTSIASQSSRNTLRSRASSQSSQVSATSSRQTGTTTMSGRASSKMAFVRPSTLGGSASDIPPNRSAEAALQKNLKAILGQPTDLKSTTPFRFQL